MPCGFSITWQPVFIFSYSFLRKQIRETGEERSVYISCDIKSKAICQGHETGRRLIPLFTVKGRRRGTKTVQNVVRSKKGWMDQQTGYQKRGINQKHEEESGSVLQTRRAETMFCKDLFRESMAGSRPSWLGQWNPASSGQ